MTAVRVSPKLRAKLTSVQQSPAIPIIIWVVTVGFFVRLAALYGGVSVGDSVQSNFTIWSMAHGVWNCAYLQPTPRQMATVGGSIPFSAPGYPLLTALISILVRVGHSVPFPNTGALGHACVNGVPAMTKWAGASGAAHETLDLGYVAYGALAVTIALLLRECTPNRRWMSFVGMLALSSCPPVHNVITEYFHPEYLLAVGLVLAALTLALRSQWVLCGAFIGAAIACQQIALLAALAIFFILPSLHRWRYVIGIFCATLLIDGPVLLLTKGRALRAIVYGSSRIAVAANQDLSSAGGTVIFELHLKGLLLFVVTRAAPLVVTGVLGWWVQRNLTSGAVAPPILISVVATAFTLRLVFEENLFSYYFMPVAVGLVLVDLVQGRLRSALLAWLSLATLAYGILPTLVYADALKKGYGLVGLAMTTYAILTITLIFRVIRGRAKPLLLGTLLFITLLTALPDLLHLRLGETYVPRWLWQVLLVPSGFALVASPWWLAVQRARGRSTSIDLPFFRSK